MPVAIGPTRIADPFAPGAGIQARAAEAGVFEREQVVAGGDSRAAHGDQRRRRHASRAALPKRCAQHFGGQESAVGAEIAEKRMVARAGHVARAPGRWSRCVRQSAPRRARRRAGCPGAGAVHRRVSLLDPGIGRERHRRAARGAACAPRFRAADPAARQAAMPPSSTATLRRPIQRASHHRRAAYAPLPWS